MSCDCHVTNSDLLTLSSAAESESKKVQAEEALQVVTHPHSWEAGMCILTTEHEGRNG